MMYDWELMSRVLSIIYELIVNNYFKNWMRLASILRYCSIHKGPVNLECVSFTRCSHNGSCSTCKDTY